MQTNGCESVNTVRVPFTRHVPRACAVWLTVLWLLVLSVPAFAQTPPSGNKDFVFVGIDLAGLDNCFPCSLVSTLSQQAFTLGSRLFAAIQNSVLALLGAFLGLYILLQTGKLMFPFGPLENAAGVLNDVLNRTLMVIATSTFLLSFANYWNIVHTPPLVAGINMTSALMDRARVTLSNNTVIPQNCGTLTNADATAVGTALGCTIRNAQATIGKGLSSAIGIMIQNTQDPLAYVTGVGLAGLLIAFISMIVLLFVYAPLYFALPLKIADLVVRWTILAILSPLIVAAAAFPVTRSFLTAALKGLFQCALELFMYGIVIAFTAFAMDTVIDDLTLQDGSNRFFSPLVNSAMFWQLLLIGWIMELLLNKARGVAIALSDPTPNPSGMQSEAFDELGRKAAAQLGAATTKGLVWARGTWNSRTR
jgi:hypothetical protein